MDDNGSDNYGMHELDWDDNSEMMAAAVMVVVSNNITATPAVSFSKRSFWWS